MDIVMAVLAGNLAAVEETAALPATKPAWRRELAAALLASGCAGLAIALLYYWLASLPIVEMRL